MKRGGIWVANLNPPRARESGKLRPVLTVQTDQLTAADTPLVIVLLQTTQVYSRVRLWSVSIPARHSLQRDCQVIVDQPRALDRPRFEFGAGPLTALTSEEMQTAGRSLRLALEMFCAAGHGSPCSVGTVAATARQRKKAAREIRHVTDHAGVPRVRFRNLPTVNL